MVRFGDGSSIKQFVTLHFKKKNFDLEQFNVKKQKRDEYLIFDSIYKENITIKMLYYVIYFYYKQTVLVKVNLKYIYY